LATEKVCKKDKIIVTGKVCPICKQQDFTTNWRGLVAVIDPEKSDIAKALGIEIPGEYALKVK
jgi:DNA-directed RNA polymerase subunit E"